MSNSIDWTKVNDEVTRHFQSLLMLDTRNPPGNENIAADYIRSVLDRENISSETVGPSPDRATIVARLKGDGSEKPLLLMGHTDVVAVEKDKWKHDPFGGVIEDGFIYGRGALDMKQMVTMELMAMLLLRRSGKRLKRDVIFMANADEEVGGRQGAGWVVNNRPDLIQAEYALSESGGPVQLNGINYQMVQTGEKGMARFRLRSRGRPGHGAIPHDDNCVFKLAEALVKLKNANRPAHLTATLRSYIEALASKQSPETAAALRAVIANENKTADAIDALPFPEIYKNRLRAMSHNTVSPTMASFGSQVNVIPSQAEVTCDARIVPGQTLELFLSELRAVVGDEVEIEFVNPKATAPLEFDPNSPLFDTIRQVLQQHDPAMTPVPYLLTGGTDAKHVGKLGVTIYGFIPGLFVSAEESMGVHGHNERLSLQSLHWGTRVLYDVVSRFAGAH